MAIRQYTRLPRKAFTCLSCGITKRYDLFRLVDGKRERICGLCAYHRDTAERRLSRSTKKALKREQAREGRMQSLPGEEWRPVIGWEDRYEVSSLGRLKRLKDTASSLAGIAKFKPRSWGYPSVELRDGSGSFTCVSLHVLVARAFLGERPQGHDVNHIDGNKNNNSPGNLEYVTHAENNLHAQRIGLNPVACENNPATRLANTDVVEMRRRFQAGDARTAICADYGVTQTTLAEILAGKIFAALKLPKLVRPNLSEAIVIVLREADGPMSYEGIRARVRLIPRNFIRTANAPTVGSVASACVNLISSGLIQRSGRGLVSTRGEAFKP